ncbi:hypothetical protein BDQ17DRAFT_1387891 [Cyathus striatus]|nr:hypothetical protein BDQ17DRAFT_1387891 [Cyathus striatus]
MPSFTTIIEDTAPIIEYSTNWTAGTSEDDRYTDKYSQSSYMVTSTDGASLSFSFYGNAIRLYGSKRPNHGNYRVELDGYVYPESSGDASDPGNFQVSLFSASALEDGEHTIILTNRGSSDLDVDFISWDTTVGDGDDNLILKTFKDNDPSFIYSPSSSWSNTPPKSGLFMGDGIAIYGPVGPDGGPYSVQMDGRNSKTLTTNKDFYHPQMMLYYANHLGAGSHVVKLTSLASSSSSSQVLAIDYAVVYTTGVMESL